MGLEPRSRRGVAALVLAGALVLPVAAAYVAEGQRTAGVAAQSAAVGLATAAWARRRGRHLLRRLTRWGARVGVEVMRNLPTPERPR